MGLRPLATRPQPSRSGGGRRRVALAGSAITLVLVLGACSSDGSGGAADGTTTSSAATSTTASATTTTGASTSTTEGPTTTAADTTPPTEPPATTVPARPLTEAEAEAAIRDAGDWDPAMGTYDPAADLSAVQAVASGAASAAAPEQVFFFSQGRYLGPATSEPRAGMAIERTEPGAVTISYAHWAPTDPFCCPSLDPWVVTFRLVDGAMTTTDELPPVDQGLG